MSGPMDSSAVDATTGTSTKQKDISKATVERLKKDIEDEEWRRREQSRRIDKEYVDRRMPYDDKKRGWWE